MTSLDRNGREPGPKRTKAVILHYGDPELTKRLHRQLLGGDPGRASDILVLDNAAPKPWAETGAEPWVRLEENLYWAGALDWTARQLAGQCERFFFLNNDIYFLTAAPFLSRMEERLDAMESALAAQGLGPVGIYCPGADKNPYHPQMIADQKNQFRRVELADGIAPCFSMAMLDQIGGIDFAGNPYGYGVDLWMSRLARNAGYEVLVDHQVVVRHIYHSTARKIDGFLATAAMAETAYLSKRMGADWQARVDRLKVQWTDHDRFKT